MADVESLPPSYNEILSQTAKYQTHLSETRRGSNLITLPPSAVRYAPSRYGYSQHPPSTYSSLLYNSTLPASGSRAGNHSNRPPAYISQIAHQLPTNYDQSQHNIEQRLKQRLPTSFISFHSTLMICVSLLMMFFYFLLMYENSLFSIGMPGFTSGIYFLVVASLISRLGKTRQYSLFVTSMFMSIIGLFVMLVSIILNFMLSTNMYCRRNCDTFATRMLIIGSSFLSFITFVMTSYYLYKIHRTIISESGQ